MVKGGEHRKSREERNSIIVGDANFYRGAIAVKNLAFPSPLTAAVAQPKHGRRTKQGHRTLRLCMGKSLIHLYDISDFLRHLSTLSN